MQEGDRVPFALWGHLRLLSRIGSGNYGEVFRAWDDNLYQEVALKLFHPDPDGKDDGFRRSHLLDEARNLAKVKHENVVRVLGADIHHGRVGFWMEFLVGQTLEAMLERYGTMDGHEACHLGTKVCRGLAAVHAAGVVHRDIKASNIFRESGGRICLLDFGAVTDVPEESSRQIGSPLYMAPETLLRGECSEQSNIYSLGVLLFHAVTGRYPVEGRDLQRLAEAHRQDERNDLTQFRHDLPVALRKVVQRCLATNPARRYKDANELEEALDSVLPRKRDRTRIWNLSLFALLLIVTLWQFRSGTVRVPTQTEEAAPVADSRVSSFFDDFDDVPVHDDDSVYHLINFSQELWKPDSLRGYLTLWTHQGDNWNDAFGGMPIKNIVAVP